MHTYRLAHGSDEEAWSLPGDREWVESVAQTAAAGNGIVLYGEPGAGQDEFAWRIARRIAADSGVLELACPPDAATTSSLTALADGQRASGRVLLIPDIAAFAGPDAEVVARLVLRHRAIVVAIASDPQGAPEAPLMQLLHLDKVRIRSLPAAAGTSYLENGLGGPLSDRSAYAVWDSGAGNRAMMRMIAEDWRESGYLVREDDVWVIRGANPPAGRRLAAYWHQWLAEQTPAVRDLFEILALAGDVPLPIVLQVCGTEAVDRAHELGYLRLRESTGREVSLRGMINAQSIAGQVPPGRSRTLLDRVTEYVDGQGLHRPAGLVPWRLHCGLPVRPERFIEGAEHLLAHTSPSDALDMLKRLPGDVEPDRVHALRIGALLAAGQFVDLWTHIGHLRLAAAAGDRPSPTGAGDGDDRLTTAPASELIAASWRGDFQPILGASAAQPRLSDAVGWLWQQVTHEAQVLTGKVQEGLHADRELVHLLEQSDTASFLVQRGRLGLFDMECLAGEWKRAAATLAGGWNAASGAPGQGRTGALYNATAHVLSAEFSRAAEVLGREIPQLRAVGRHDLLPLAYSLHAVSLARIGRRAEALVALAAVDIPRIEGGGIWRLIWAATYFSAQAMGYLGRAGTAVERLVAFAELDRRLGNHSQELLTLTAAVQWGHEPALDMLAAVATRSDGRFAEACTWVTRGLQRGDPEEVEYGALLSRSLGQHFFADYAQTKLESLNGPCPHAAVDDRPDDPDEPQIIVAASPAASIHVLTPRQRAVVQDVLDDRSNGDIARSMGVSVRTVESHLYQVYAKLNVTSRTELRSALTGHSVDSRGSGKNT
ncbi:LuxR C-terminal-related transcriptional regulator [Arthrobacter sp. JSM 101049]|uniref:helix-turn-helix transcriptional regulator n=1 Tax=Arthrobacter sp. JSM 101049 TaxID=929097 RepID=UPI00356325E4